MSELTYDNYVLKKIYDKLGNNISSSVIFLEVEESTFLNKLGECFGINDSDYEKFDKIEYYHSKSTNNLEPIKTTALLWKDFAVTFTTNNVNDESGSVLNFDYDNAAIWAISNIVFYYDASIAKKVFDIIKDIKNNTYTYDIKNRFYTIGADNNGFILNAEKINPVDINISLNYGKKFVDVHDEILSAMKNLFSGLVLLYGEPGTGKTMYIRYLISLLCIHKTIIYVPAYMIEQLANPEFISFIQQFKEAILILEDAEFALQARSPEYGAQAVSNLLNITNGLLNDVTKIQVIATFNMERKNLDKALLRPGRLLKEWKFDKLSIEDSKMLATHLSKDINITSPMTVAEIYSGKTQSKKSKKRIGIKEDNV